MRPWAIYIAVFLVGLCCLSSGCGGSGGDAGSDGGPNLEIADDGGDDGGGGDAPDGGGGGGADGGGTSGESTSDADPDPDPDPDADPDPDDADPDADPDPDSDPDPDPDDGNTTGGDPDPDDEIITPYYEMDDVQKSELTTSVYDVLKKKKVPKTFDAYSIFGLSFRILCEQPCQIEEGLLKKKYLGAKAAIDILLGLVKYDAVDEYQPIDIYITSSAECGDYDEILADKGFVGQYFAPKIFGGSYMCLWEADYDNLVLPFDLDHAGMIEAQKVLVHEYSHIIFDGRTTVSAQYFEGFVKALSFYVSGLWDGKGNDVEDFPKITDACDPALIPFAEDVYDLCTNCGFGFEDVSTILMQMELKDGLEDASELKSIIDGITGKDSVTDCGIEWLGI